MKKIRVQLQGGLGNQLFIWAMAHELQQHHSLKVDLIYVEDKLQRSDRLNELAPLKAVCKHGIRLRNSRRLGLFLRIIDKSKSFPVVGKLNLEGKFGLYSCNSTGEFPEINYRKFKLIRGYFQNSLVVEKNRLVLSQELNQALDELVGNCSSDFDQALHIRRGDTLSFAKSWGVLDISYYLDQISANKSLAICTDDPDLGRSLKIKYPDAYVSIPQTETTWQTLRILSRSKEFIGANSTLSWWAAWIIKVNAGQIAILPKPWRPSGYPQQEELMLQGVTYRQARFKSELL